ncbi:MAG: hypothetical protein IPN69_24980 [Acidobacteria bacterium]|nr:hypothetical protein [Acidobacteriota bacterium]MBK8147498.1 hypothetical protein [Acidobacteriota bacterium]MBK8813964.1 hypothetical protein [Acidobacteriota bacterium]
MLRKLLVHFVLLTTISLMTSVELFAQTRIRFAKGRSSATISGTIPARSNRTFVVGARSGQTARVSVNNRNLKIFSEEAPKGESGSSSFETYSGDNEFGLSNPTNQAIGFTMTVSIR